MAIVVAGSALCAMAREPLLIVVGQFLIGVGIGIDFPASGSYVSEIMPRSLRSRMTVATIALQSVGMILAAIVAIAIFRSHPSAADWRVLLGTGGLLAALYMGARLFLPESPRWLAEKGQLAEAAKVLSRLTNTPVSATRFEGSAGAATSPVEATKPLGIAALFSPRYRTRTLLVSIPWLLMDVATYGVGLFTPVILGAMHFESARNSTVAAVLAEAEGSGLVDLFLLAGFIVGIWAIPHFGRISLQVAGFFGMTLGMLLLMFAAMAADGPQDHIGLDHRGLRSLQFFDECRPERHDVHAAARAFSNGDPGIGERLRRGMRKGWSNLRHVPGPSIASGMGTDWRARVDGVRKHRRASDNRRLCTRRRQRGRD